MDKFTASNGVSILVAHDGDLGMCGAGAPAVEAQHLCNSEGVRALREFFAHERDVELGRSRSKKHPHWTAVLDEPAGIIWFRHENGLQAFEVRAKTREYGQWALELREVAAEYFAAHPEPKPWHDAKPGEVWEVSTKNQESLRCWVANDDPIAFVTTDVTYHYPDDLISARRIFPEVSDD